MAFQTSMPGSFGPGDPAQAMGFKPGWQMTTDYDSVRANRENLANRLKEAGIQANASMFPHRLQQERFNKVFPWLQGQFGNMMGQFNSQAGGASGQGPYIGAKPIINPQMQNKMVMNAKAQNEIGLASEQNKLMRSAAARGVSPLSNAIQSRMGNMGMQMRSANTKAGYEIPLKVAQMNAPHLLQAQQAREAQFASRQQEDIDRRRVTAGLFPSLFSALGGIT